MLERLSSTEVMQSTKNAFTNARATVRPEDFYNSSGAAYAPLLMKMAAPTLAGVAGWGTGRVLGNTPLLTDPSVTYDDMFTQFFQNKMTPKDKKKKKDVDLEEYLPLMAEAVQHAENDATGNNGIRGYVPTDPDADLQRSVQNNFNRWQGGQQPAPWIEERPPKFVDFMRRRWAPLLSEGATDDPDNLNVNWAPNVRHYLQQNTTPEEYQMLQDLNFARLQGNERLV